MDIIMRCHAQRGNVTMATAVSLCCLSANAGPENPNTAVTCLSGSCQAVHTWVGQPIPVHNVKGLALGTAVAEAIGVSFQLASHLAPLATKVRPNPHIW